MCGQPLPRSGGRPVYSDEFEAAWSAYPRRAGSNSKREAYRGWTARLREGVAAERLTEAVARYASFCRDTGKTGTELVMQAQRFFGPRGEWENEWSPPRAPTAAAADAWEKVIEWTQSGQRRETFPFEDRRGPETNALRAIGGASAVKMSRVADLDRLRRAYMEAYGR